MFNSNSQEFSGAKRAGLYNFFLDKSNIYRLKVFVRGKTGLLVPNIWIAADSTVLLFC